MTEAAKPANRRVRCPQCGTDVPWTPESTWRPFCSERCKLIDLGAWASESYRIPEAQPSQGSDAAMENRDSDDAEPK